MIKYKSEVEMKGVSLKPRYARTRYTVVDSITRDVWKAQRLHYSYNVAAVVNVYEKSENEWRLIDKVLIDPMESVVEHRNFYG